MDGHDRSPDDDRWSRVGTFPSRAAAGFAAAALHDAGITARVAADDGGGTLPHLDPLTGGVRLLVPARQAQEATDRLRELDAAADDATTDDTTAGDRELAGAAATPNRLRIAFVTVLALALAVTVGSVFLTNGSVLP